MESTYSNEGLSNSPAIGGGTPGRFEIRSPVAQYWAVSRSTQARAARRMRAIAIFRKGQGLAIAGPGPWGGPPTGCCQSTLLMASPPVHYPRRLDPLGGRPAALSPAKPLALVGSGGPDRFWR